MFDSSSLFKEITGFDFKQLHKKVGRLLLIEPSDSDIQEGNFVTQLWFQTGSAANEMWLIAEWDSRKYGTEKTNPQGERT